MEKILRDRFVEELGYEPDFKNPKTYQEKIHHKMLYDRNPLIPLTSDKFKVYDYIKYIGMGHLLIPLLYDTNDPETIPFNDLPDRYVIKPNHASGRFLIVRNGTMETKKKNFNHIKKGFIFSECRKWLRENYKDGVEWAYTQIKPHLIVQQFIGGDKRVPDYKFYVTNGKCDYFMSEKWVKGKKNIVLYDRNGALQQVTYRDFPNEFVPVPENLSDMLGVAEKLGSAFDSVRVDLYNFEGKIYFGELTHYPASGRLYFTPKEFEQELGKRWKI